MSNDVSESTTGSRSRTATRTCQELADTVDLPVRGYWTWADLTVQFQCGYPQAADPLDPVPVRILGFGQVLDLGPLRSSGTV